jgi:hypothetical protein
MDKLNCTKTDGETKNKGGRPPNPNKRTFMHIGLRPADMEYLKKWQSESGEETNFNDAIERIVEFLRIFAPGGPMVEKPRDDKGRFLPENGTSKMAICRRKRRERREREEAGA